MKTNKKFTSVEQMRKIDAMTSKKFGISSLILMENAGRICAQKLKENVSTIKNKQIVVICGNGNNGGDGFVAARYLINDGLKVKVILVKPQKSIKGDAKINFDILKKLKATILNYGFNYSSQGQNDILKADIIIDAMLGTGAKGKISGAIESAICNINKSKAFILSIDIPSGIDGDNGNILGNAVKASLTITLALPKLAFKKPLKNFGKVCIVDIGIPRQLLD